MSNAARLAQLRTSIAALRVLAAERSAYLLPRDVERDTPVEQRLEILRADPRFVALVDAEHALDAECRELELIVNRPARVVERRTGPFALHVIRSTQA
jgi:hypothetical protein